MGSSGCGKTTLISSLVGVQKLDYGDIRLFGEPFRKVSSQKIGFMPQETALVNELKIVEMMWLFGTIFGMTSKKISERFEFLTALLDLPYGGTLIENCSGGQKRRISFGLSMLHEPELLLLDEPTVGIDPMIRNMIWSYLEELTQLKGVTVLVSTHYVDEAKKSNQIGFMKNGVNLIESSPQRIMQVCETTNLNEAFVKLCERKETISEIQKFESILCSSDSHNFGIESNRSWSKIMSALLYKQFIEMTRNLG
jgi:ABC-type multidrug transport system ATPase subunit